jgi:putative membrane protein insertion efficiency factor
MQTLVLYFIKAYRFVLSPFLGQACRFEPTCSRYTEDAIKAHGVIKGSALGVKRICRCHPWNEGGFDPVPDTHHHPSGHTQPPQNEQP